MTPDEAVGVLERLLASRSEFTEDDLHQGMADAGIPPAEAERAIKFAQIAWGRGFLETTGVQFSDQYSCLGPDGVVSEAGELRQEPHYAAAWKIWKSAAPSSGLARFAAMSADVNAVNQAVNAGSSPEDLVTGPMVMFMDHPTPLERQLAPPASRSAAAAAPKPWWKFW